MLEVFSVRDAALGQYGRPFYMVSKGQAMRSFADEVNRAAEDNQMYQHPEDFDLFKLGTFDEESGKFFVLDVPQMMSQGVNVKR